MAKTNFTVACLEALEQIAQRHLGHTLAAARSDHEDFFETSVWACRDALVAAFNAGLQAADELRSVMDNDRAAELRGDDRRMPGEPEF